MELSRRQAELMSSWLPDAEVVADYGWGLVDNVVLHVSASGEDFIVKADGAAHDHISRELDAHEHWLARLVERGRAPRLFAGDREAKISVTYFVPGRLVLGSPAQHDPGTFRQAGELLALLHARSPRIDRDHEARENAKVLRNLEQPHRIGPDVADQLREVVASWPEPPVRLVPTHGDWQPRNWLSHEGRVTIIDFGRAALRPAVTDWLRLDAQDFRRDPLLEAAFLAGYGADPRADEAAAWLRERLREAVNTAVWARRVGDRVYEDQGLAMIAQAVADL